MKEENITILSEPSYLANESSPKNSVFVWMYEITLTNHSQEIIQLLTRYWRITDMLGKVEEVQGLGVVGLQPLIKPGKRFVYSSYCQLSTPQGSMEGYYEMQTLDEKRFLIQIPKFALTTPAEIQTDFRSKLH